MKLGEFELLLLNRLRELGPITPTRLLELIKTERPTSFSTLAITLRRLERKGLIRGRVPGGRSREYWVEDDNPVYQQQATSLSQRLVKAFGANSLLALTEGAEEMTSAEIDQLIDNLERIKAQQASAE